MTRLALHLLRSWTTILSPLNLQDLKQIEKHVELAERSTSGEVCFALEKRLPLPYLLNSLSKHRPIRAIIHQRAIDTFSHLRIWDTEKNNGVLIYLLVAERSFEIVADRGLNDLVPQSRWEEIANQITSQARSSSLLSGILAGIDLIGEELAKCFPPMSEDRDELSNRPSIDSL